VTLPHRTRRVFDDPAALEAIAPAWERLLEASTEDQPVLSPLWLLPWWRVFGRQGGRRLRVLALFEGERLVALAPLLARTHRHFGLIPLLRLEVLGSGEPEEHEIFSEYLGFLVERARAAELSRALVDAIVDGALGPFDELVVPRMDGEGPLPALLRDAFAARGLVATLSERTRAPYVTLPRTFRDYLARLGSSHRYVVTRSRRDLEAHVGAPIELHVARTAAELAEGAAILRRLHAERWSARGASGAFGSARFQAFHAMVMPALLARGALSLSWITAHGEPLAALYSIVWRGKVHFYQGGRRVDLPAKLRPGIVAHALAIERAIEGGLREYDFLGGEARYKQQLATASRPLVDLRAARPSTRERLRVATAHALDLARAVRDAARALRKPPSAPAADEHEESAKPA
jgi:CelD/BcsL family acetyltransferase involved in cellulose biosynthesis